MADNLTRPARTLPQQRLSARALRLGGRLNLAGLDIGGLGIAGLAQLEAPARSPPTLRLESSGIAALFSYGTVVFIGASASEQEAVLKEIESRIEDRLDTAAVVASEIELGPNTQIAGDRITIKEMEKAKERMTERLERKLQEKKGLDFLRSYTTPGLTTIFVNLKGSTSPKDVPEAITCWPCGPP